MNKENMLVNFSNTSIASGFNMSEILNARKIALVIEEQHLTPAERKKRSDIRQCLSLFSAFSY